MVTSGGSKGFYVVGDRYYYNGDRIPTPPSFNKHSVNITTINDKIYVNGYEYFPKQKKWKRTFSAIWHYLF